MRKMMMKGDTFPKFVMLLISTYDWITNRLQTVFVCHYIRGYLPLKTKQTKMHQGRYAFKFILRSVHPFCELQSVSFSQIEGAASSKKKVDNIKKRTPLKTLYVA